MVSSCRAPLSLAYIAEHHSANTTILAQSLLASSRPRGRSETRYSYESLNLVPIEMGVRNCQKLLFQSLVGAIEDYDAESARHLEPVQKERAYLVHYRHIGSLVRRKT